ncbi:MAG: major capsid protein [Nitrosomonas sp.]|uniref:major capsid protein n=1 Tax=Nitrosomonas sp. TaxID=42353 RepID=UPI002B37CD2E|nr:major capsid protein [Nitrosomonas sp.]MEB2331748.1 major capsid protein [Nitrosomonas sp.]
MKFIKQLGALLVSFFAVTGVAHAALPEAVTDAITTANTDIATAGGLILAVIIGIKVFKWIQRVF